MGGEWEKAAAGSLHLSNYSPLPRRNATFKKEKEKRKLEFNTKFCFLGTFQNE